MKKTLLIFLCVCAALTAQEQSWQSVVDNNMAFGLDLNNYLDKKGNLFFSPYGLTNACAVLYLGAKGETEKQIAKVLHFPSDQRILQQALQNINKEVFLTDSQLTLKIANRLWIQENFPLRKQFITQANQYYQTDIVPVDFITKKIEAVEQINEWIEEETFGKIKIFLEDSQLNSSTKIILVDLLYFKAGWLYPFNKSATEQGNFKVNEKTFAKAVFMHQVGSFHYLNDPNFSLLELPYVHNSLSCFFLLPKDNLEISEVEKQITTALLYDALNRLQSKRVEIYLPKFYIENKLSLNEPLKKLGLTLPFNAAANFSAINGRLDLYLSQMLQQTYITVDEEGTEAATATGAVMATKSVPLEDKAELFRADRPFFFFIQDKKTKLILFFGRLMKPQEA